MKNQIAQFSLHSHEKLQAPPPSFLFFESSSKLELNKRKKPPFGAAFHLLVDPEREQPLRKCPVDIFRL